MPSTIESVGITMTVGTASFCYVSVSAPGFVNRGAIDTTCLSNTQYITKRPPTFQEISDISFTARYEPEDWDKIDAEVQNNQSISLVIPNKGTYTFYGYLASWEPAEAGENEAWNVTGTIIVTNETDGGVETAPTFTAVSV